MPRSSVSIRMICCFSLIFLLFVLLSFTIVFPFFLYRQQNLIAPSLSRPVGSGTHPRLALSRMQMLEQLVLSQGISSDKQSGLTCRILSECGCSGIHHPAEPVRKVAERVLLLVYKVNPRLVRKLLPPDDDITRRNLLYRQLFAEFDKIDEGRRREMISANQSLPSSGILKHSTPPFSPNAAHLSGNQTDSERKFSFNNGTNSNSAESTTVNSPRKTASYNHSPTTKSASESYDHEPRTQNSSKSNSIKSECENRCPFCDWPYNGDAEHLDKHYWKACPILTKCPQCSLVLEVAALCTHLIGMIFAEIAVIS